MKKIISAILVFSLFALILSGCAAYGGKSDYENIRSYGRAVVGITDFAPMDYRDENGEWTGFDAELARLVFGRLGLDVEFSEIDWDNKIFELSAFTIDCVWNGMTLTDEVRAGMSCTEPYILNAQVVIMPKDKITGEETEESIGELNIAVEAGSAGDMTAADFGFEHVTQVDSQAKALMEIAAGTSDAAIVDLTMAVAMTGEGTSYPDLAQAFELTYEEYGIGFRKDSDMAPIIDGILDEMKSDGSLQELADKYGLSVI